jgi:hypothetical protein
VVARPEKDGEEMRYPGCGSSGFGSVGSDLGVGLRPGGGGCSCIWACSQG